MVAGGVPEEPWRPVRRVVLQRHVRLEAEQVAQLVADYQAGETVAGVARKYRVSVETASRWLRVSGVQTRRQEVGIPAEEVADARVLREAGWTLQAIGERYGCSRTAVANALRRVDLS